MLLPSRSVLRQPNVAQWAVRGGIGKNFKMGKKTTHLSFHIYEGQKLVEF